MKNLIFVITILLTVALYSCFNDSLTNDSNAYCDKAWTCDERSLNEYIKYTEGLPPPPGTVKSAYSDSYGMSIFLEGVTEEEYASYMEALMDMGYSEPRGYEETVIVSENEKPTPIPRLTNGIKELTFAYSSSSGNMGMGIVLNLPFN